MCAAKSERSALDIATEHTLQFVKRALPRRVGRALEVGCGDGWLAQRLRGRVGELIAIDRDTMAVKAARKCGVEARQANWLEFDDGAFDAILFTCSLHHIAPLGAAIERAAQRVAPGGILIVEDFGFDAPDARTVDWLRGATAVLRATGAIGRSHTLLLDQLSASEDALTVWRGHHGPDGHGIHRADDMAVGLRDGFADVCEETAPYLYRYLCAALSGPGGAAVAAALLDAEEGMIQSGGILAVGRRWVATDPRSAPV